MTRRLIVSLVALAAAAPAVAVAEPTVEISADARRIYVGLPFNLDVVASGFDETPQPEAPDIAIDGCEVTFAGASPRVSRSLTIVGGRRTETVDVTYVYRYRVTPSEARRYQVPAVEITQGPRKARSTPVSFSARTVPETDRMALRLSLPDRPVWIGETFEMSIDWYVAAEPSRPSFRIPLFEQVGLARVAATPGAARSRRAIEFATADGPVELAYAVDEATLDGRRYSRLRFEAQVTPQKAGAIALPPAAVVSELEVGRPRSPFGRATTEVFLARDEARTLEVKALPQVGRPASFRNAVGTGFAIDVEASRTVVRVGEPIELSVTIRGDVPLAGIALPKLEASLPGSLFELPEEDPVGEVAADGRTKTFRVTARLASADAREIPPLELSYFNPVKGAYEVARSEPIALQVAGSAVVGAEQVASATRRPSDGGGRTTLVGADLSLSSPGETLDTPWTVAALAPALAVLYAVPLLVLGVFWWRRRTAGDRDARSARKARERAARAALDRAAREPGVEVASELAAALRALAKERGFKPDGFDAAIAELETTAYNPRADSEPLPKAMRERCRALVDDFAAGASGKRRGSPAAAALILFGLGALASEAYAAASIDEARASYRQALAMDAGDDAAIGRFADAARQLGELVREHPGAPELLVDWGNASLGARELGWAALAYRRALHADRGVSRARTNLAWVRESLGDWPAPESGGAIDSLLFWHRSWNVTSRHLAAAIAFAIAALLLAPRPRSALVLPARIAAGAAGVVFAAMLLSALLEPDHRSEAVVVADDVTLRSADVAGAPAVIARPLPAGLEVDIVETRDRWVQIALADGRRGWLSRSAVMSVVE